VIDDRLHAERLGPNRTKRTFRARLGELPDALFIQRLVAPGAAYLIWKGSLLRWSPGGYQEHVAQHSGEEVLVVTPKSTVGTIRAGYVPVVHPSAGGRDQTLAACPRTQ
jgi:hypothetical protein